MPSFGATGALFAKHFDILEKLKRRIKLLKQAYDNQNDVEKTWEQVDRIVKILEKGSTFLDFNPPPSSSKELEKYADDNQNVRDGYATNFQQVQ